MLDIIKLSALLLALVYTTTALTCAACDKDLTCPPLFCGIRKPARAVCGCCDICGQLPGEICNASKPCGRGSTCFRGKPTTQRYPSGLIGIPFPDIFSDGVCVKNKA